MAILLAQERGLEQAEGGQGRQGEEARVGGKGECGGREREGDSSPRRPSSHSTRPPRRPSARHALPNPAILNIHPESPPFLFLALLLFPSYRTHPRRRALDLPHPTNMAARLLPHWESGNTCKMAPDVPGACPGPAIAQCFVQFPSRRVLRPQVRLSRISIPARRLASSKARYDPPACTRSRPVHRSWDHGSTLGGPLSSGRVTGQWTRHVHVAAESVTALIHMDVCTLGIYWTNRGPISI